MRIVLKTLLLGFCFITSLSFSSSNSLNENGSMHVFESLDLSIRSSSSMQFTLVNYERIGKRMMKGKQKVSLIPSPFQCYILMIEPGDSEELVYAGERYSNFVIYEPNGFPYIQLELDPKGSLMRKNNHHTIFDLGFGKMMEILKFHMHASSYEMSIDELRIDRKDIQKLSIEFTNFSYSKIVIKQKESLSDLANRMMLNDYMLYEINGIGLTDQLKVGSNILVPSAYAKKIELYIDKASGYPVSQIIFDDKGLYEKYEYSDLVINSFIPESRFKSENLGKSL